jgi:hypothetical protein
MAADGRYDKVTRAYQVAYEGITRHFVLLLWLFRTYVQGCNFVLVALSHCLVSVYIW